MREIYGDLWKVECDWRGITTNGFVKKDGTCVMGRGCAKEAAQRFPHLPWALGQAIRERGNVVHLFHAYDIFTFPVKNHWYDDADLELIEQSVGQLDKMARKAQHQHFVLPRPGCGNGHLSWNAVEPLLVGLPDNVSIITWRPPCSPNS